MFRVERANDLVLVDDQERARRYRGRRPHANRLTGQAPFPERIPWPMMATTASLPVFEITGAPSATHAGATKNTYGTGFMLMNTGTAPVVSNSILKEAGLK